MSGFHRGYPPTKAVSALPAAASSTGQVYQVSDALSPTIGSAVSGGGAVSLYVKSNGTNWLVQYLSA